MANGKSNDDIQTELRRRLRYGYAAGLSNSKLQRGMSFTALSQFVNDYERRGSVSRWWLRRSALATAKNTLYLFLTQPKASWPLGYSRESLALGKGSKGVKYSIDFKVLRGQ